MKTECTKFRMFASLWPYLEKSTVHVAVAHSFQRFGQSALKFKHFKGRTDPGQHRAAYLSESTYLGYMGGSLLHTSMA